MAPPGTPRRHAVCPAVQARFKLARLGRRPASSRGPGCPSSPHSQRDKPAPPHAEQTIHSRHAAVQQVGGTLTARGSCRALAAGAVNRTTWQKRSAAAYGRARSCRNPQQQTSNRRHNRHNEHRKTGTQQQWARIAARPRPRLHTRRQPRPGTGKQPGSQGGTTAPTADPPCSRPASALPRPCLGSKQESGRESGGTARRPTPWAIPANSAGTLRPQRSPGRGRAP